MPRLKEALIRGDSADTIVNSWKAEVDRFKEQRKPYLLYAGAGEEVKPEPRKPLTHTPQGQ